MNSGPISTGVVRTSPHSARKFCALLNAFWGEFDRLGGGFRQIRYALQNALQNSGSAAAMSSLLFFGAGITRHNVLLKGRSERLQWDG